jgi:hypothetical protein
MLSDGLPHDELGVFLQVPVDSGLDHHVLGDIAYIGLHEALDPVGDVGLSAHDLGADALVGIDARGVGLGFGDVAFLGHGLQHESLPCLDGIGVAARVEPRGRLQRAGEDCGLS